MNKISSGSYKVEDIVGNFSLNLKKGKRVKSSQVHETYVVYKKLKRVSLINKCKKAETVMEKLLCYRYFGEKACKSMFSDNQVNRLGRYTVVEK